MHAISTASVIRAINIPSAKQVRECGARVICAYIIPLILRILWNISALPVLCGAYGNLLRPARLPTRKRRSNVSTPIRASANVQDKQIKAMNCIICKARVGSMSVRATNDKKKKSTTSVVLSVVGDPYGNRTHVFSVRG